MTSFSKKQLKIIYSQRYFVENRINYKIGTVSADDSKEYIFKHSQV